MHKKCKKIHKKITLSDISCWVSDYASLSDLEELKNIISLELLLKKK